MITLEWRKAVSALIVCGGWCKIAKKLGVLSTFTVCSAYI